LTFYEDSKIRGVADLVGWRFGMLRLHVHRQQGTSH
jgi:hypothetical protein